MGLKIDYPCKWDKYMAMQQYWNNIALESSTPKGSNTYKNNAILEVVIASNTKCSPNIIIWWYRNTTIINNEYEKMQRQKESCHFRSYLGEG